MVVVAIPGSPTYSGSFPAVHLPRVAASRDAAARSWRGAVAAEATGGGTPPHDTFQPIRSLHELTAVGSETSVSAMALGGDGSIYVTGVVLPGGRESPRDSAGAPRAAATAAAFVSDDGVHRRGVAHSPPSGRPPPSPSSLLGTRASASPRFAPTVYVACVLPDRVLGWTARLGGDADDIDVAALALDTFATTVYVGGSVRGGGALGPHPPDEAAAGATSGGGGGTPPPDRYWDWYVAALDAVTGAPAWAVRDGSAGRDGVAALAAAPGGGVYAAGTVGASWAPTGNTPPAGVSDALALRLAPGGGVSWAVQHAFGAYASADALAVVPLDPAVPAAVGADAAEGVGLWVGITTYRAVVGADGDTSDAALVGVTAGTGEVVARAYEPSFSQVFVRAAAAAPGGGCSLQRLSGGTCTSATI